MRQAFRASLKPNDTYVEQLVASAEAAVRELAERTASTSDGDVPRNGDQPGAFSAQAGRSPLRDPRVKVAMMLERLSTNR